MKINRVNLTNYRNHASKSVDFTDGINLLLGKNGAGKTSILEALGIALFDGGIRGGNSQEDAVKKNEKFAIIQVEFTGNDGLGYRVERRIGASPYHKIFLSGEKSPRYNSKEAVIKMVKELSGISPTADLATIYKSVITAKQNEMTEIFTKTAKEREKTFNAIFETDIYGEIFKFYSKNRIDEYKSSRDILIDSIKDYTSKIKDSSLLETERDEISSLCESSELTLNDDKAKLSGLEQVRADLRVIQAAINENKRIITGKNDLLKSKISQLTDEQSALINSENSAKIVSESQVSYDKYLEINSILKDLNKSIEELENIDKSKRKLDKESADIDVIIAKSKAELQAKISDSESRALKIDEMKLKIPEQEEIIAGEADKLETAKAGKWEYEKIKRQLNELIANISNSEKSKSLISARKLEKENSILDKVLSDEKLIELDSAITSKNEKIERKKELNSELSKYNALISENNNARKELNTGVCPLLKETCQNVVHSGSGDSYFSNRANELNATLKSIVDKIEELGSPEKELKLLEKDRTLLIDKIRESEKAKLEISGLESDLQVRDKEIENFNLQIQLLLKDYKECSDSILACDYRQAESIINDKVSEFAGLIASSQTVIDSAAKRINEINSDIKKIEKEHEKLIKTIATLKSDIDASESRKVELTNTIDELKAQLNDLENLKVQRSEFNDRIEELAPKYKLYLAHEKTAKLIDSIKDKIDILNDSINTLKVELIELEAKIEGLTKDYSQEKFDANEKSITELKAELDRIGGVYNSAKTALALKNKEIADNAKIINEVDEKNKTLKVLSKKIEIAENLRDNLNNMGRHVAARALEKLEFSATENYRKISGKSEFVLWKNESSSAFQVYLSQNSEIGDARKFEQLSGGEQVAVALSLRAALASMTTKADFAIFDEPTVNLDVERRAALAESLDKILQSMKQAIIVTHDDSFKEMANNVIDLSN